MPQQEFAIHLSRYTACADCDLLMPKIRPLRGHKTVCPRCGRILMHHCSDTVSRSLAISLTGLLLFFPATLMPLLTFNKLGMSETGSILQTAIHFFREGYHLVAVAVLLSAVIIPFAKLGLLMTVSLYLRRGVFPGFLGSLFRFYNRLNEWAMVEVYLLGIMVTIIKMYDSTEISYNTGFFCFIGLVIITVTSHLTVCRESFWNLIETRGRFASHFYLETMPRKKRSTAAENNLILCRECGKLSPAEQTAGAAGHRCDRCGASLHPRKVNSIARTWALVLTATILFFPANMLPIMRVEFMGFPSSSTILDGIKLFFEDGSYAIALIILSASILIPVFKIVGLIITLVTIHLGRPRFLRQKTMMFRFIEFIGRWSMLDIFVIALLGYFVNFSFLTSIETAPAATYFALVVVTTMMAAITFDPRIMWDVLAQQERTAVQQHTRSSHGKHSRG